MVYTFLIPSSQDFFKGFPHDKNVVIALDKVQPVHVNITIFNFSFFKKSNFFFIQE